MIAAQVAELVGTPCRRRLLAYGDALPRPLGLCEVLCSATTLQTPANTCST